MIYNETVELHLTQHKISYFIFYMIMLPLWTYSQLQV